MENTQTTASLEDILSYTNEDVIDRFLSIYDMEESEALSIFEETKKWLWLSSKGINFVIDDSLLIIDEMWHNFILFTKDYDAFCHQYFGRYIHHQPSTRAEKEKWFEDVEKSLKEYKKLLTVQYGEIYDHLGEETLNKWYVYFSDTYTKEYIHKIMK